jgi:hypothetical protein
MKILALGWQNIVYDLGNGRVRKVKLHPIVQYLKILESVREFPFSFRKVYKEQKRVNEREEVSNRYVRSLLGKIDLGLFGNPVFSSNSNYEQDKVLTVEQALKIVDVETAKKIIRTYVEMIYIFWSHGFSDTAFKIGNNNGVNEYGRTIQIDFGELTTDKEEVREFIRKKSWLRKNVCRRLPSGEMLDYYATYVTDALTEEELDRRWGIKLE